jgi:hypothetical protein
MEEANREREVFFFTKLLDEYDRLTGRDTKSDETLIEKARQIYEEHVAA